MLDENKMVKVEMNIKQLRFLIELAGSMDFDAINMMGYFDDEAEEFFEACEDASLVLSDNYYQIYEDGLPI